QRRVVQTKFERRMCICAADRPVCVMRSDRPSIPVEDRDRRDHEITDQAGMPRYEPHASVLEKPRPQVCVEVPTPRLRSEMLCNSQELLGNTRAHDDAVRPERRVTRCAEFTRMPLRISVADVAERDMVSRDRHRGDTECVMLDASRDSGRRVL